MMETSPEFYGLSPRVVLENLEPNVIGIRKVMKSRIIRKDAEKIVEIARQIKSVTPNLEVTLICSRNICTKSVNLIIDNGIKIQFSE